MGKSSKVVGILYRCESLQCCMKKWDLNKNLYGSEDGPREIKKNGLHLDSDKRLLNLAINKLIISHLNKGSVSERGKYTPTSLSQLINKTTHIF